MNVIARLFGRGAPPLSQFRPRIVIFGVGGGGGNALDTMIRTRMAGVEFVAANTDAQALSQNLAPQRIQMGRFEH